MTSTEHALSPIDRACEAAGGTNGLARAIQVTPQAVSQWRAKKRAVPPARCIKIEVAVDGKVTRYELRPDVFGAAPRGNGKVKAAA